MSTEKLPQSANMILFTYTFKENNVVVDLTSAASARIIFTKPDGTEEAETAAIAGDPTTGQISFSKQVTDIGIWYWQGEFTDGSANPQRGEIKFFRVLSNDAKP